MKSIYYLIVAIFIFYSCNKQDTNPCSMFKATQNVRTQIKELEDSLFFRPYGLICFNNRYLITHDVYNKKIFTVINLEMGVTKRFGRIGHGPGEFLPGTSCSRFNKKEVLVFNPNTKDCYVGILDSVFMNNDYRFNAPIFKLSLHASDKIAALNDTLFISEGVYKNNRLALFDVEGKLLNTYLSFPETNENEKIEGLGLIYQGKICGKPTGSRFAHITYNSSNIGFYKIEQHNIVPVREIFLFNPLKDIKNLGNLKTSINLDNCKVGFLDVYSTDHFIYTLYSDENQKNHDYTSNIVLVYDWSGNPIRILNLDRNISDLTVSDDDSTIYGLYYANEKYSIIYSRI